jgi:hypothetical protein
MAWLAALLAVASGATPQRCVASNFGGRDDEHRGSPSRCLSPPRRIKATDRGIAHRRLPCGARVAVINPRTRRAVITTVIDHGPYGATHNGSWRIKRRRSDPGKWRGCADLTWPVAKEIDHNSFEPVILVPLGETWNQSS